MTAAGVAVVVLGYALGALPFAWFAARLARGVDLRRSGSGNVGATNVLRTSGALAALAALALDVGKGVAAVVAARRLHAPDAVAAAAGLAAVVGHVYPVWLRFRGGRGVATAAGAFGVLAPLALLVAAGVFAATLAVTRYVSLASVIASITLALSVWVTGAVPAVAAMASATAALVVFRHRGNLERLRAGTEPVVGRSVP